jgi:hypothetical protein
VEYPTRKNGIDGKNGGAEDHAGPPNEPVETGLYRLIMPPIGPILSNLTGTHSCRLRPVDEPARSGCRLTDAGDDQSVRFGISRSGDVLGSTFPSNIAEMNNRQDRGRLHSFPGANSPRRAKLAAADFFKACYLSYFSRPSSDRILFRTIRRRKVRRILEIGIGLGRRALRMIEMAQMGSAGEPVHYTGIDFFESRSPNDGPGLTVKAAHQLLGGTGARIRLVPGDLVTALARTANSLSGADLVVLSARLNPKSVARAWFYLPRVLNSHSHVFCEETRQAGVTVLRALSPSEVARLTEEHSSRRAA